jgi:hypothetical protein
MIINSMLAIHIWNMFNEVIVSSTNS